MARPSRIAILKELGSRSPRCLAAHAAQGQEEQELVIVERYPASLGEGALATLEEDTKALVDFHHPNAASIIASVRLKGDVAVLSEWVDGESLESMLASSPPVGVLLRVLVEVLDALEALHAFGGGGRVCGALGPEDVFVGVDGVTRIARFGLGRLPAAARGEARAATMAPEFRRGERSGRGDVYTVGTLAWRCLAGAPYAPGAKLDASPDVAALAPLLERALAVDPAARWATARELKQAIVGAAPGKIGARGTVSQFVARTFGGRIEARIAKLEPKTDISLSALPPPVTGMPPAVAPGPAPLPTIESPPKPPDPTSAPEAKPPEAKPPEPPQPEKPPEPAPAPERAQALEEPAKAVVAPEPPPAPEPPAPQPVKPIAATAPSPSPAAAVPRVARKVVGGADPLGARRAVPLPKRTASQPDSAPKVVPSVPKRPNAPSAPNGSTPRAPTPAAATAPTPAPMPKPGAPPAPDPKPPPAPKLPDAADAKGAKQEAPVSVRTELDVEVDLASSKPSPLEIDVDLASVPPPTPSAPPARLEPPPPAPAPPAPPLPVPDPASEAPRGKRSMRPPAVAHEPRAKLKSARPPPAAAVEAPPPDDAIPGLRKPSRAPVVLLGAVALAAASFVLGRYTMRVPPPAAPSRAAVPAGSSAPPRPTAATSASSAAPWTDPAAPTARPSAGAAEDDGAPSAGVAATASASATAVVPPMRRRYHPRKHKPTPAPSSTDYTPSGI